MSWVLYLVKVISFYILVAPSLLKLSLSSYVAVQIIYAILMVVVAILTLKATLADTTDPLVTAAKALKEVDFSAIKDFTYKCSLCSSFVHDRTKHCGSCNKCTLDFDHHCMWLNNCIGSANYATFFQLIVAVWSFVAFHFAFTVYAL